MATPSKDEIIALEKDYWEAMKRKDGKRTAQLSGDGALVTGARGVVSLPEGQNESHDGRRETGR